jgi:hypothetical protein
MYEWGEWGEWGKDDACRVVRSNSGPCGYDYAAFFHVQKSQIRCESLQSVSKWILKPQGLSMRNVDADFQYELHHLGAGYVFVISWALFWQLAGGISTELIVQNWIKLWQFGMHFCLLLKSGMTRLSLRLLLVTHQSRS